MSSRAAMTGLAMWAATFATAAAQPSLDYDGCVERGREPPILYSGLGDSRMPALFGGPGAALAQRYFDQGLALLYAYSTTEAVHAFAAAADLDPAAPAPLWGVAMATGPDINTNPSPACLALAHAAAAEAAGLLARRTPPTEPGAAQIATREQALVAAVIARYAVADGAVVVNASGYAAAMGEAAALIPQDHHLATLHAAALLNVAPWRWWIDGAETTEAAAARAILREVLALEPGHLGANHYFIHASEQAPSVLEALPVAERMAALAPGLGHIAHMPSHIFQRIGDHARATAANRLAVSIDRSHLTLAPEDSVYALRYLNHNLHFLAKSLLIEGRDPEALAAARELLANTLSVEQAAVGVGPQHNHGAAHGYLRHGGPLEPAALARFDEVLLSIPVFVVARAEAWDGPLDLAVRGALAQRQAHMPRALLAWSDARRALREAAPAAATDAALAAFWLAASDVPAGARFENNAAVAVLRIAMLDLLARAMDGRDAAEREALQARAVASAPATLGPMPQASDPVALFTEAVAAENALTYAEPPNWPVPMREALGAALLRAGDPVAAGAVFRAGLQRRRRDGRLLFGLDKAMRAEGIATPLWLADAVDLAWRNAATPLSLDRF